jgi:hypothetical protein
MSNGFKPMMSQGLQINLRAELAPLMTPVLRRSRDQRPVEDDEDDDAPWRERRFTTT